MALTEAEAMWAENQGLLTAYLHRTWGPHPPDWLEDAARWGFIQACLAYVPERGRFSSLAWTAMRNAVRLEHRRRSRDAAGWAVLSLDDPGWHRGIEQEDGVAWDVEDETASVAMDDALLRLDLSRTRILHLLARGLNQTEAARAAGVSRQGARGIVRREAQWYLNGVKPRKRGRPRRG
jgi:hypothetical protein